MKSYNNYDHYPEDQKKQTIEKFYINEKKSFADIANILGTYANKIRRDAIKFQIPIRSKSEAQSNALQTGVHKHPTKGTIRSEETKEKIGMSVMNSWDNISKSELKRRQEIAKNNWDKLPEEEKQNRLNLANLAVRNSSRVGSKLEHYLLEKLIKDGYKVDFHKEQILSNTKLQIDIFLPTMNIAIEVDGPSHFLPVWGKETLARNQKYDKKKTGLIIGKGLKLIRVKQVHDFSKSRSDVLYEKLIKAINDIKNSSTYQQIEIED